MKAIRLLPFAFLFTGAMTILDRGMNDELTRLAKIRQLFISAVSDAKGRLTQTAWGALSDPQVQQNLEMGNINTVSQLLQAYVRPGEVSQLDLLDADCNLLTRVPQGARPISDVCQEIKNAKPALTWQLVDDREPVLVSVVMRSIGGREIFVASQLPFDHEWLSLHHELANVINRRDASIGIAGAGAMLWREGLTPSGKFALPIYIDGWIYRLFPEVSRLALVPIRESFWLLYGTLGVIILLCMIQVSSEHRAEEDDRAALEKWVFDHQSVKSTSDGKLKSKPASWSEIVERAKTLIAAKDEHRAQQMRLLKERNEDIMSRLREREAELAQLENKLVSMSDLASLQEQLQHTTASFLRQMNQMREVCENIYDVTTSGLAIQAKALGAFSARWKDGIRQGSNREMAARKFFRSLVETRGEMPGSSRLDDDMRELDSITAATLDQSINAAMLAQQAVGDCEAAAKLAALWHGMATRDQGQKTSEWSQCLVSAQSLITADDRFSTLTFETLPKLENCDEIYPSVASSVLISGFFHLYSALLAGADVHGISLPLVVRQKQFKDQGTIILSLPNKQVGKIPESPVRQMIYHVDLAKQILSGCRLRVTILPPTVAGYPVGVTWSLPQKEVTIVQNDVEINV